MTGGPVPRFALGYALLAVGFLLLNETIRDELIQHDHVISSAPLPPGNKYADAW